MCIGFGKIYQNSHRHGAKYLHKEHTGKTIIECHRSSVDGEQHANVNVAVG